jgi:hypothetical protein
LIDHNEERINKRVSFVDKTLFSGRDDYKSLENHLPKIVHLPNTLDEKVFVLEKIQELTQGDNAITL